DHIRSHSASQSSLHVAACAAHAPLGYTDTKHSGKTTRVAPSLAASPTRSIALSIVASASRITGVAWTAATHTVSNPVKLRMVTIRLCRPHSRVRGTHRPTSTGGTYDEQPD